MLDFGSSISELILSSDHDTVTSPSETVATIPGLLPVELDGEDKGVKGVIPNIREESLLSSRDRGVDKSGIVLRSGM